MAGTPGRLRAVGIASVVVTLLFGLAAGQAFRSADGALSRAAANSDQLVRIQAIQTNVVQADADATNAFLVGGLEPAAQRADYTEAIAAASGLIAQAAQNQPADGNALAALNQSLVSYTSQVEQARANNRQALPIGAQYLRSASADLRADALPLLTNLGEANNARVTEEFDRAGRAALWLVVAGILALAVLGLSLVWLARRTRRYVNVPLAAAALVVLVTLVVGTVGLLSVRQSVDTTRAGVYAATLATAQARIAGFDAKSNESLTLIARGSGCGVREGLAGLGRGRHHRARPARREPGIVGPRPAALVGLRHRPPGDPRARRRRRLGGRGRAGHRLGRHLGQRDLRRLRHRLRHAADRPQWPDRAAARRHRRVASVRRGARPAGRGGRSAVRLVGRLDAAGGVPMSRRPLRALAGMVAVAATLAAGACTTAGAYDPTPLYTPSPPAASPSPSATATPSPAPSGTDVATTNCLQSYAPPGTMPEPGAMPAGSTMAEIKERGRLIAGVSADTLLLGARNPVTGRIEGFDIDMLRAVSQAIFGDPNKVELKVITAAQRLPALQDGTVDIVARNMTITCNRWKDIAFSSEYYRSGQKVLVRLGETTESGGPIRGIEDLAGKKVCAPNGSTSMDKLRTFTDIEAVGADTHTGCLVLFQQGAVDGITGDDTVLAGLAAQDPYADVVQAPAFTAEPYGLGVNQDNVDFVQFVNGVLEDMKADGRWTKSYNTWLADSLGKAPAPPKPVYGRAP